MAQEKKQTQKEKKPILEEIKKDWIDTVKPGMTVRVHQKIKEFSLKGEPKERVQVFEGIVLARKHGKEKGATITVRKVSGGIGVEKIFPLHSPNIIKIEPTKQAKTRRAKLFFLREKRKKGKRLKEKRL